MEDLLECSTIGCAATIAVKDGLHTALGTAAQTLNPFNFGEGYFKGIKDKWNGTSETNVRLSFVDHCTENCMVTATEIATGKTIFESAKLISLVLIENREYFLVRLANTTSLSTFWDYKITNDDQPELESLCERFRPPESNGWSLSGVWRRRRLGARQSADAVLRSRRLACGDHIPAVLRQLMHEANAQRESRGEPPLAF